MVGTYGSIERGRHSGGEVANPTLGTLFRVLDALGAVPLNFSSDVLSFSVGSVAGESAHEQPSPRDRVADRDGDRRV